MTIVKQYHRLQFALYDEDSKTQSIFINNFVEEAKKAGWIRLKCEAYKDADTDYTYFPSSDYLVSPETYKSFFSFLADYKDIPLGEVEAWWKYNLCVPDEVAEAVHFYSRFIRDNYTEDSHLRIDFLKGETND